MVLQRQHERCCSMETNKLLWLENTSQLKCLLSVSHCIQRILFRITKGFCRFSFDFFFTGFLFALACPRKNSRDLPSSAFLVVLRRKACTTHHIWQESIFSYITKFFLQFQHSRGWRKTARIREAWTTIIIPGHSETEWDSSAVLTSWSAYLSLLNPVVLGVHHKAWLK